MFLLKKQWRPNSSDRCQKSRISPRGGGTMKVKNLIVTALLVVTLLSSVPVRAEEMTLEQKVAEVLACGFVGQSAEAAINNLQYCNNVVLMGGNVQGMTVEQVRNLTDQIHAASPDSWVMVDEEGGQVQRIDMQYPSPRTMGSEGTAAQYGQEIGQLLNSAGIDVNLAPVADIEDGGGVIGDRSFGVSPEIVSANVTDFLVAMQEQGVLAVIKHLPGHGRIEDNTDTHVNLGVLPHEWGEITEYDLVPFLAAFESGAKIGMLGHIAVPSLDGNTPTSQSRAIVDALRTTIPGGESVVLMTDEISMGGAGSDPFQAAVQSLAAGADMILYVGSNPEGLYQAVLAAYQRGTLDQDELDRKVGRIQSVKGVAVVVVEEEQTAVATPVSTTVSETIPAKGIEEGPVSLMTKVVEFDQLLNELEAVGLVEKATVQKIVFWLVVVLVATVVYLLYKLWRNTRKKTINLTVMSFWFAMAGGVVAFFAKTPFTDFAAENALWVWGLLWLVGLLYKAYRHMGGKRLPDWTWSALLTPILVYRAIYVGTYGFLMLASLLRTATPVEATTTPASSAPSEQEYSSETTEVNEEDVLLWTGAPLAKLPEGYVIPAIWNEVWAGVQDEGGTVDQALRLYYTQRSEFSGGGSCTKEDHAACTSSAGAVGWFQFMPTTWPSYAEPEWSPFNLRESARAAYRMFERLKLFEQSTKLDFQNRFTGQDGGMVWNRGYPDSDLYDGWDQAGAVWDNYQAALTVVDTAEKATPAVAPDPEEILSNLEDLCQDPLEPCGFALPGGPGEYVLGVASRGYKGWHENAWDWWYPGEEVYPHGITPPTSVLSMLNGQVTEIGRFNNGGLGGGTTYLIVSNGRWTQTIYHCDENYVEKGDEVEWGTPLCLMGNQGTSDWTHLHLSLKGPDGYVQDQTQWWP